MAYAIEYLTAEEIAKGGVKFPVAGFYLLRNAEQGVQREDFITEIKTRGFVYGPFSNRQAAEDMANGTLRYSISAKG